VAAESEDGMGWEAARPCSSKETKPTKIDSLIEKIFCGRPLKEKEVFVDFVHRQAATLDGLCACPCADCRSK